MLCFSNPGEIDPRLITTLGVNVKEGSSPIGFFGTGLKYAIASALRNGWEVVINSGERQFRFGTISEKIRGQAFQMIDMIEWIYIDGELDSRQSKTTRLGFTTDLGKTWEFWMIYRELWSNARDESGEAELVDAIPRPEPGLTSIVIGGGALEEIHKTRSTFILEGPPDYSGEFVDIHNKPSQYVFYRDLRVYKLAEPSLYTYNIKVQVALTEDRTLSDYWRLATWVAGSIVQSDDKTLITRTLRAPKGRWEKDLQWSHAFRAPSETFSAVAEQTIKRHRSEVNDSAREYFRQHTPARPATFELSLDQGAAWEQAKTRAERLGFFLGDTPVEFVNALGENTFGEFYKPDTWEAGDRTSKIRISRAAFAAGSKALLATLLEEILHKDTGHEDATREFQNALFAKIIELGEQLLGEAF